MQVLALWAFWWLLVDAHLVRGGLLERDLGWLLVVCLDLRKLVACAWVHELLTLSLFDLIKPAWLNTFVSIPGSLKGFNTFCTHVDHGFKLLDATESWVHLAPLLSNFDLAPYPNSLALLLCRLVGHHALTSNNLILSLVVHLGKVVGNSIFVISPQKVFHWDEGVHWAVVVKARLRHPVGLALHDGARPVTTAVLLWDRALRNVILLRLYEVIEVVMLKLPLRVLWQDSYFICFIFEGFIGPLISLHSLYEIVYMFFVLEAFCLWLGWWSPLSVIHLFKN